MSERKKFAQDWFNKGDHLLNKYFETEENGLLFESYIYLWISLTIASKEYCANDGKRFSNDSFERSTDREEILYWAESKIERISQILSNHKEDLLELSERKGTEQQTPIIDTKGRNIEYYQSFAEYFQGNDKHQRSKDIVKTMIIILNQIRNNLFHGGKSFSVESDIEILRLTSPILRDLADLCIKT